MQNTYTPCVDTSNVNGSPILGIRGPFVGLHDVVPLTCTVFYQCHQNGLFEELGNSKISIQYLAYVAMFSKYRNSRYQSISFMGNALILPLEVWKEVMVPLWSMLDDLILSLADNNIMSHWSKYAHLVSTHPIISSDAFNLILIRGHEQKKCFE